MAGKNSPGFPPFCRVARGLLPAPSEHVDLVAQNLLDVFEETHAPFGPAVTHKPQQQVPEQTPRLITRSELAQDYSLPKRENHFEARKNEKHVLPSRAHKKYHLCG